MRKKSLPAAADKKERVIHTRVPEALDDEVRRRAGDLGLSVSNLVRNILENTFGLVEDIVSDSARIAQSATGKLTHRSQDRRDEVLGWTPAVLNLNAVCERCNALLAKGARAAIAVTRHGGAARFCCQHCMEEVTDGRRDANRH